MTVHIKNSILFLIGGLIYYFIEVFWRGYSHWTMFLLGGICFVLIGLINEYFSWDTPLWQQACIASIIVTEILILFSNTNRL